MAIFIGFFVKGRNLEPSAPLAGTAGRSLSKFTR